MPNEITPSAVYPAGTPIPSAPPLPPAPAGSTDLPPWRTAAAAPPPPPPPPPVAPHPVPAPDPGPIEHRVTVEVVFPEPEVVDEPGRFARLWSVFAAQVKPWHAAAALAAAVIPIPWTGYSAATTWAYTMHEARELHVGLGYGLAFGTFALACRAFAARRKLVALWACAVTGIGIIGATDWFDVVTALTGVRR